MRELVLVLMLAGCMPAIPDLEPHKKTEPDAAAGASAGPIIILIPENCRLACKNLHKLGCAGRQGSPGYDEVWGTLDDISCEVVCADLEKVAMEIPGLSLNPACLKDARDCRQASECVRVSSEFQ